MAGFDPFDPKDYAEWLSDRADQAGAFLNGMFGANKTPRPSALTPSRLVSTPTPSLASPNRVGRAAEASSIRPSEVSLNQNRQHSRIGFAGYEGRGYVVNGFEKYAGWEVQLVGRHVVREFQGGLRNECAQFVQMFGIPRTNNWRKGPQVCHLLPGDIPTGTVIATLRDGVYHNDYSGRSHVGIYVAHDVYDPAKGNSNAGGVWMFDQWNGSAIAKRLKKYSSLANKQSSIARKPWTDTAGRQQTRRVAWASDGEEYFVMMTGI